MAECMHELAVNQCTICTPRPGRVFELDHDEPVTMEARYKAPCPRCGGLIWPGDTIAVTTDEAWICPACIEALEGSTV